MSKKASTSRILRQLAEALIGNLVETGALDDANREDLATSLVRQWVTYDGSATLFIRGEQVDLVLGKTPLGNAWVVPRPGLPGWMNQLTRDWRISEDALDGVIEQLNRGQSAEVTNEEGVPLRLWFNPKERSRGVEPLVKQPVPSEVKRDYRKIAASQLEQEFGLGLDAAEMEALAGSVARQWQKHQGHACLFIGEEQLVLTLTEIEDGGCRVEAAHLRTGIEALLQSLGFAAEVLPQVIAKINLDQEVEFHDRERGRSLLWHDPIARRIRLRRLDAAPGG